MNNVLIVFNGGVIIAAICTGALIAYFGTRLSEEILKDLKDRRAEELRRREHDLWVLQHFGKLVLGLHERDGCAISLAMRAINVESERRTFALERHLSKEPRRIGTGSDKLAGIP
jgi:hypothetical protein